MKKLILIFVFFQAFFENIEQSQIKTKWLLIRKILLYHEFLNDLSEIIRIAAVYHHWNNDHSEVNHWLTILLLLLKKQKNSITLVTLCIAGNQWRPGLNWLGYTFENTCNIALALNRNQITHITLWCVYERKKILLHLDKINDIRWIMKMKKHWKYMLTINF